ncbi:MAG TPA: DUF2911 domain-containing protein [Gemmatimonadaceae bacterium]|nr:DUF2911 domain-containing protein [Gemmatimonadaceae bacterium]
MHHVVRHAGALLCLVSLSAAGAGAQQASASDACWIRGAPANLAKRPSKLDSASVTLGSNTVKVCYGSPQKRGRKIMGGLVPYGQPWRMGANEATTIHVPVRARIAGVAVQPGWYSLYAVPGEREWRIVVNSQAQRWGIPIDSTVQRADVGSGTVPMHETPSVVEALTEHFESTGSSSANLVVEWDRAAVRIPVVLEAASSN